MPFPQQPMFQGALPFQQAPVYQQSQPFYAQPYGQMGGSYQMPPSAPLVQQSNATTQNVATRNKRKKKMNVTSSSSQSVPPPQMTFTQPQFPFMTDPSGGMVNAVGASSLVQAESVVQTAAVSEVPEMAKPGKCWKCSVDTHATKDCKVQHYCLVCDTINHPTLRCPTLKLPKPQAFVGGPACEESLCLRLPDSVYKAHLAPKGSPIALIKITGGSASAVAIQKLMARICPLSSQWKWEAIPHGEDAYLVSFPTVDDLKRVDGFQMGVPDSTAQISVSIWKTLDVPHKFELQQVWVHVEGVPHTVRHFLGLWAVGSLIGTTLDVDLVSLRSLGVVRILVAMMEPKNLDKMNELQGYACLGVSVTVKLKSYDFFFRREQPNFAPDKGFTPFF
jgi:hypothetical protein